MNLQRSWQVFLKLPRERISILQDAAELLSHCVPSFFRPFRPISLYFPLSISASFPLRRRRKREKSLDIFGAFWGKYVHPSVSYLGARPSACGHVHLYFIIVSEVTFLLA